jgi:H+/Cl- antiporter ClcA
MASGLSSPLGIAGIIAIIIGIIAALIGIILLIVNQNSEKPWYIWLLLIGGVIIGIIGGVMLAIALSEKPKVYVK